MAVIKAVRDCGKNANGARTNKVVVVEMLGSQWNDGGGGCGCVVLGINPGRGDGDCHKG